MAAADSQEIVSSLLLVKAVLALLAALLFIYYRHYWQRAKRHLAIHFFYAKWRAVRHAVLIGIAAAGFAAGFSLELLGTSIGLSANMSKALSSLFEIGALFCILFVFFQLSLEDVPHFQHIADAARRHAQRQHHHHASAGRQLHGEKKARKRQAR